MLQELADRVTSHCLEKNNRCKGRRWNIAEEPGLVKEVLRQSSSQTTSMVRAPSSPLSSKPPKNFLPQNFVFPNKCHERSLRLLVVNSITGMSWLSSGTPSKAGILLVRGRAPTNGINDLEVDGHVWVSMCAQP